MRTIYIFDIDGTLCDITHRLHFIQQEPKDWRGFFAACVKDSPIEDVIELEQILATVGSVILISGRSDECRDQTVQWLDTYSVAYDRLYMRKAGDHRHDHIVKGELLDRLKVDLQIGPGEIAGVFEDRTQVVKMYRERGLLVFQVADGDF